MIKAQVPHKKANIMNITSPPSLQPCFVNSKSRSELLRAFSQQSMGDGSVRILGFPPLNWSAKQYYTKAPLSERSFRDNNCTMILKEQIALVSRPAYSACDHAHSGLRRLPAEIMSIESIP